MQNTHLVILAGGVGSRLWPLSNNEHPKQFLDVLGCGKTLIQLTLERFKGIVLPENVWVATSQEYRDKVHEQLPEVPEANAACGQRAAAKENKRSVGCRSAANYKLQQACVFYILYRHCNIEAIMVESIH